MKTTPHPRSRRPLVLLACLSLAVLAAVGMPGRAQPAGEPGDGAAASAAGPEEAEPVSWSEVDRLVSEQKYEAAHRAVMKLLDSARAAGDADEWTRALVEATKLRMGLHGYETAVRFLKETPWPSDAVSRAVLELYYANALATYARVYSWEIRQRERVASGGELELERWTMEQIVEAADCAYLALWRDRAAWGSEPLGELARYIEQNSYPPRIRGTLRDAVSYLWVEQLADSSLWSPAESNGLFRLDVAELLAGEAEAVGADLGDPDVHPVRKLAAVLGDLEAWHEAHRRPEAAMEARLELVRRVHEALAAEEDRSAVREHLVGVLERFDRSLEWWSVGQSLLAELLRQAPHADALIEARAAARAGRDRHPESIGGRRCAHLVALIEQPSFDLAAMAVDGPGKRSLQITHTNIERLHFRAWRYDLVDFIERAEDYNLLPSYREAEALMAGPADAAWSLELPPTPDYRPHQSFAVPELGEHGAWLIAASLRADFAEPGNERVAVNFLLSDLVLLTRDAEDGYEVTARSGAAGRALEDVEVTLYRFDYQRGHRAVEQRRTGGDGRVRFGSRYWSRDQHFVLARQGEHLALDTDRLWRPPDRARELETSALLYTDRAVYRPLQELHWKVVAYRGGGEEIAYQTLPATDLEVSLIDANGDEVAAVEVTTNGFGSASGSFEIPAGRLLGQWRLRSSLGGDTWLRVEEYKRPTFVVEIDNPEAALRLNREAALGGSARYYFGLPVTSGELRWRVSREPVYPRWWSWWHPSPSSQPQVVAGGESALDEEGRFELRFTPEADEREAARGVSYRYRLAVDVTDEGGETRSAERVFRLGFVAVEARLLADRGFVSAGEAVTIKALRNDLDGTPRPGAASWRLVRLEQPAETLTPAEQPLPSSEEDPYATPGDRMRPRWQPGYDPAEVLALWPDGEELAAGELAHGEDGGAELALPGLAAGAYRLHYRTADEFGAEFSTREHLVVVGERRTPLALPALLRFEQPSVAVGETARLLVHTGFTAQEMVLELYRDGRRIERRDLGAGRSGVVELPVTAADRGGMGVALTLLRDHQLLRQTASLAVPWDDRRLDIELASFRDTMRPGTRESFAVTVRRHDGAPVDSAAAELLALMYDRSLDIFAPYEPPSVAALYPDRSAVGRLGSSLGRATQAWGSSSLAGLPGYPHLSDDRLKLLEGYGIGGPGVRGVYRQMKTGMVAEATAELSAAPPPAADEGMANEERLDLEADAAAPSGGAGEEPGLELRTDFAETAFWRPHLVLEPDGSATVEFEVPDSVTEWNLWVHAVTRDLKGGSVTRTARSVKELMVRPYLPRFLREGDRALLEVAVNNAGEMLLSGALDLELFDPETGEDLRPLFGLDAARTSGVEFSVAPGAGTTLSFPLAVPSRVGQVAFKATARADGFSDGELRSLPVLPGRMHLAQSRFVALRDRDRREMHFADLAAQDDPTLINDQLVVTVDGQLFYSVLNALPYLVQYPYECTEQTLNRFLSTGIVASLFDRYPAVERMAERLSARETRYEAWRADDPNRAMSLVETPWLALARGGGEEGEDLVNVLDPAVTRAQRSAALAELAKSQTSLGGFPWFPGGPPSPWMTLYILSGFSKGLEFGVEAPEAMVREAWAYLHRHWVDEWADWMVDRDCCWETITFLNYVLSSYPDESWTGGVFSADDRRRMLDFSFRHWREHSPLTKGYLALTLERVGRHEDAVLVFDAVMDSATTDRDLGTYWAPEDRAWLWYNDTIETHAFALRTLTELAPDDERRHGLVQWLFLNKKLNHWKSTRATAEVLYSLAHYLQREETLASREVVAVAIGPRQHTFVFSPDEFSGARNQLLVRGRDIEPDAMATVVVEKETPGFAFASATWHFSTERLPDEARGDLFAVERSYFRRFNDGSGWVLEPLADGTRLEVGDQVEVQLAIRARHAAEYVHLRDPRGAGFEPETLHSQFKWDLGIAWYEEVRDSGTNFFFEWLPAGEYAFSYRLRATMAGTFRVAPTVMQSMYAPEFTAYSAGNSLEVDPD